MLVAGCTRVDPEGLMSSARDYLEKGDAAAAVIQLKNALQDNPELGEARLLLGQALLQGGDPVGAEVELKRALDLGVPAERATPLMAKVLMQQGRSKDLTDRYAQVNLELPQDQADLQTLLARAWREQGRAAEHEAALARAFKAVPSHSPALLEQARARASGGNAAAALTLVDSLLKAHATMAEAHLLRADLLLATGGDAESVITAFRQTVAADPTELEGRIGLVRTLLGNRRVDEAERELGELARMASNHPATRYLQAQMALARQKPADARELAQQLLTMTPGNPLALELAGMVELANNAPAQAEPLLSRALATKSDMPVARRLLVSSYLRLGQPDRALAALPPEVIRNSSDPALLALAGQAFMLKGQTEEAQLHFTRAAQLDPGNARYRTAMAMSQLAGGASEAALASLNQVAASDDGSVADMALISTHLRLGRINEALVAIDRLEKKRPGDPLAWQLRGRALSLNRDAAGARAAYEKALSLNPGYFAATAALSQQAWSEGQHARAVQLLREAVQRDPRNLQASLALAEAMAMQGAPDAEVDAVLQKAIEAMPSEWQARLALIERMLRRDDAKAAVAEAQRAVAALPEAPQVHDALGRAHLASGDTNQALASFARFQALSPESVLPHLRRASAQLAGRDEAGALRSVQRALEAQPDHVGAQRLLVDLATRTGQLPTAIETARSMQRQRPGTTPAYQLEGDLQMAAGNAAQAVSAYETGLGIEASAELAVRLHAALTRNKEEARAARVAADWIRTHPQDVSMLLYLSGQAINARRLADASRLLDRVLALQPDHALALNNQAWVSGQTGRSDALALAERANQVSPNQPMFMDTLALLLSQRKEHARALEIQQRAVALQPKVPLFKLTLAKIHLNAGNKAAAAPLLDELSALGARFEQQAEVEKLRRGN
jgi:putative PEP-CTERM system TPR-repeat lipoprotein